MSSQKSRSRFFRFAGTILVASIFLAPGSLGQLPKFVAEVPLLDCDGTPCVEARIGTSKALKLGIDIGDVDSVLDSDVARSLGLKPAGQPTPGAPPDMFRASLPTVQIGSVSLTNQSAIAMGLGNMISQGLVPKVDGTLAYTAFHDRILQIDFVAHKVRISDVLAAPVACEGACDKFSIIKFGNQGPPIVVADGFAINGKNVTAQIDTMYTGSMLIYGKSIDKLGLAADAKTERTRYFPLTDGGVKMLEAARAKESFKGTTLGVKETPVYFPTEGVREPDGLFDATVGLELFYGAVLTLNFHDSTVSVQKF